MGERKRTPENCIKALGIDRDKCFECSQPMEHWHHVVPFSKGGKCMVPLCNDCHGLVHDRRMVTTRALTVEAMRLRRAKGMRLGRKVSIPEATRQRIALERASGLSLQAIANGLTADGVPTRKAGASWHSSTVAAVLDSLRADAEALSIREAIGAAA